jgi:hypothetical protein
VGFWPEKRVGVRNALIQRVRQASDRAVLDVQLAVNLVQRGSVSMGVG